MASRKAARRSGRRTKSPPARKCHISSIEVDKPVQDQGDAHVQDTQDRSRVNVAVRNLSEEALGLKQFIEELKTERSKLRDEVVQLRKAVSEQECEKYEIQVQLDGYVEQALHDKQEISRLWGTLTEWQDRAVDLESAGKRSCQCEKLTEENAMLLQENADLLTTIADEDNKIAMKIENLEWVKMWLIGLAFAVSVPIMYALLLQF